MHPVEGEEVVGIVVVVALDHLVPCDTFPHDASVPRENPVRAIVRAKTRPIGFGALRYQAGMPCETRSSSCCGVNGSGHNGRKLETDPANPKVVLASDGCQGYGRGVICNQEVGVEEEPDCPVSFGKVPCHPSAVT